MVAPFNRWTDRIIAAEDESSRQALAGEIARWRAGCLTDVAKQRDAAHALARLYMLLGLQPNAVQEGQTLMSLCQIPPEASEEEWAEATAFLTSLGGTPPRKGSRPNKKEKGKKEAKAKPKSKNSNSIEEQVEQVLAGKAKEVRGALKGKKGARLQLLRIWMTLHEWRSRANPMRCSAQVLVLFM